jgi:hypothetical protein
MPNAVFYIFQTPAAPRYEAAIKQVTVKTVSLLQINNVSRVTLQNEMNKIRASQLAYEAQLLDPDMVYKSIEFTNFLSVWIIRSVDPKKSHPRPTVDLPLPEEVPMYFRTLPEYFLEDIIDYLHFAVQ